MRLHGPGPKGPATRLGALLVGILLLGLTFPRTASAESPPAPLTTLTTLKPKSAAPRPKPAATTRKPRPKPAVTASRAPSPVLSPPPAPATGSGRSRLAGALLAGVPLTAAVAAGALLWRRRRGAQAPFPGHDTGWSTVSSGPPTPPAPPTADLVAALSAVADSGRSAALTEQIRRLLAGAPDRATLVQAAIRHHDQLAGPDPGLAGRLLAGLHATGVQPIVPDDEPFDPRWHEAVDTVATTDPGLRDRVAETVRCGYRDGAVVLRIPRVVIYR
ncbi:nucleotide exchange factor GrpE [Actinoplanes regularis]|uniref:nucleotide exchange factor GrpE n=1 Tax=Actinoplanes regularis TaxID=52697 RepID=UPI0019440D7F|nr:nucleotide exchange factor GrpE [Actinoplanes regularis]